ncbi:uncharacterized protein LOC108887480 [Lates calcarifer]|uniref:Uncharacterized protein LOC108887480 n=1 Tax=Lates calcarifer TaxID=8187 RepID=A0AAJ8DQR3_LATCA|nr:uncharacterized protein LOC108887480 [Lates calcarifer]
MMMDLKWIKVSLFLSVLLFTAVNGQTSSITVRAGDEATLSCGHVIKDQDQCNGTTWIFSGSGSRAAVTLFEHGQIHNNTASKSDRLSVTENCSLVIKKVTVEDAGRYTCRQFNRSGRQQAPDAQVELSVVTMTEQKNRDHVTLNCSVRTYDHCRHTVKWLFKDKDVNKDEKDLKTSQSDCSAKVTITTSHFMSISNNYALFKCNVTDKYTGNMQLFTFSLQSSDDKTDFPEWATFIIVAVGLLTLLMIFVVFIKWKRNKANKTQMDDKIGWSLDSAVPPSAPETIQDTADPEDGLSYVSVSYTKTSNSKAQGKDGENDTVTYTTVKVHSSSAGASTDPCDLYATIIDPSI